MVDQSTFMETVKSVAQIMATAPKPLTADEILAYFEEMNLTPEQKKLVLSYLLTDGIKNASNKVEEEKEEETAQEVDETGYENSGVSFSAIPDQIDGEKKEEEPSTAFSVYLREVSHLKKLNADELVKLYQDLLDGKQEVIEEIVNAWMERVLILAKRYVQPKIMIDDIIQEGNIALYEALIKLAEDDMELKAKEVDDRLLDAVEAAMLQFVSGIEGEFEGVNAIMAKGNLIRAAQELLSEENGTVPTVSELAQYTNMDEAEITMLLDFLEEK